MNVNNINIISRFCAYLILCIMSSIHYKFKATLEYKTLTFDGLHIIVEELKRVICDKENIRTESFDLVNKIKIDFLVFTLGTYKCPHKTTIWAQRVGATKFFCCGTETSTRKFTEASKN